MGNLDFMPTCVTKFEIVRLYGVFYHHLELNFTVFLPVGCLLENNKQKLWGTTCAVQTTPSETRTPFAELGDNAVVLEAIGTAMDSSTARSSTDGPYPLMTALQLRHRAYHPQIWRAAAT